MNIRSIHVRLVLWYTMLVIVTSIGFSSADLLRSST